MLRPPDWPTGPGARSPITIDLDQDDDRSLDFALVDPARYAATIMLGNALHRSRRTIGDVARDGNVIVALLPDVAWIDPVIAVWASWIRPLERSLELGHYAVSSRGKRFVYCAPTEKPNRFEIERLAERFGQALARHEHCVGIAADPEWLPHDLLAAADRRITLRPLDARGAAECVQTLTGGTPRRRLTQAHAARLLPRHLRLATRADQTADAYVRKLRTILKADPVARPNAGTVAPRVAPTLDRLHGMDEAVRWGDALARDLKDFRTGRVSWSEVDGGCLLSGPPGCGKTHFAQALAATCDVPLVVGSYGQWIANGDGHQGNLIIAMRKTFKEAREQAPSILFIDEIDSFPDRARTSSYNADWVTGVVNTLLTELDGVGGRPGVVVIGVQPPGQARFGDRPQRPSRPPHPHRPSRARRPGGDPARAPRFRPRGRRSRRSRDAGDRGERGGLRALRAGSSPTRPRPGPGADARRPDGRDRRRDARRGRAPTHGVPRGRARDHGRRSTPRTAAGRLASQPG